MINMDNLIFAFEEEIGDTSLFSGRKEFLDFMLLKWVEAVRKKGATSLAIMARRKKGKTALVQRFYNILFTMNDPQIIPFYYKVKERPKSMISLSEEFYHSLICQYAAFKTRDTDILKKTVFFSELKDIFSNDKHIQEDIMAMERAIGENNRELAWTHASEAGERISILKNERIIQIIDEFQYLNDYIYTKEDYQVKTPLCGTYHHVGASKISPVIVTGSYVYRLSRIVGKMTGRYTQKRLKNLTPTEAIESVYKYASVYGAKVTEETAAYMAMVTDGDPFYISRFFSPEYEKDLTSIEVLDDIIMQETSVEDDKFGHVTDMWNEYLDESVSRINDQNGKKIVLYLAKLMGEERTVSEIMTDLQLDMTEVELRAKLEGFIQADILSHGKTFSDYKGLGDKYFDLVFRGMFQKEIDNLDLEEIKRRSLLSLKSLLGGRNYYRGLAEEFRVLSLFLSAIMEKTPLSSLLSYHIDGYELGSSYERNHRFRLNIDRSNYVELDIYLQSRDDSGNDFIIEVKDWEKPVDKNQLKKFIELKTKLGSVVKPDTGYIFCSKEPLPDDLADLLKENGIMIMCA